MQDDITIQMYILMCMYLAFSCIYDQQQGRALTARKAYGCYFC